MINGSMASLDARIFAKDFNDSFNITQINNSIIASVISPLPFILIHCRLYSSTISFGYKGEDIFSIEEKEKFTIPFYNLPRILEYYTYCYFDDPNHSETTIFSDTKKQLSFEFSNLTSIPCVDWTFENLLDDDRNNTLSFDGIEAGKETIYGMEYISCTIAHFTDFSIGISGIGGAEDPENPEEPEEPKDPINPDLKILKKAKHG